MLTASVLLIAWIPLVSIPRKMTSILLPISAAAYFIYLAHVLVVQAVRIEWNPPIPPIATILLVEFLSIFLGLVGLAIWKRLLAGVQRLMPRNRSFVDPSPGG